MQTYSGFDGRSGVFMSSTKMLVLMCIGGFLLFSVGQAVEGQLANAEGHSADGILPNSQEPVSSTCKVTNDGQQNNEGPTAATLTISKDTLSATLRCEGEGNAVVPTDKTMVCIDEENATVQTCTGSTAKQVALTGLLAPAKSEPITKSSPPSSANVQERTLKIQESQLPFTDKTFFVGCQKKSNTNDTKCKVTVKVKARASSAQRNAVVCAYGEDSNNEGPVRVEMSEEQNKLSIDCGQDGAFFSVTYTEYCPPESTDLRECTEKFADLLPSFSPSWWVKGDKGAPSVFTIPATDFPAADRQFMVGCAPRSTSAERPKVTDQKDESAPSSVRSSLCRVVVTVKATRASSATSRVQTFTAASAVAAAMGFIVWLPALA
ncbi:SAG-related sequence [Besnoitia besnoiti]|uniref:SAG-related sequence n=1 Tax=Besnoitia besnoiti TaxID=94643 RepID=A0A2A9MIU0_BESBE|nr:SAG-related sequence [Besnoitia besnoiti]PFH36171.1 SAG-related sequence [Besnoitia besnoiti]